MLERLARLDVAAQRRADLGEHGDVVIADGRYISLLRRHGEEYVVDARMELPDQVPENCYKAVDENGRVLVQATINADTICLDNEGREIDRHAHPGRLLGSTENELFYRESTAGGRRITVQRGTGREATYLQPPHRWSTGLSVCRHNGRYYVTDSSTQSLDIFNTAG
jgi:hypothetical protein